MSVSNPCDSFEDTFESALRYACTATDKSNYAGVSIGRFETPLSDYHRSFFDKSNSAADVFYFPDYNKLSVHCRGSVLLQTYFENGFFARIIERVFEEIPDHRPLNIQLYQRDPVATTLELPDGFFRTTENRIIEYGVRMVAYRMDTHPDDSTVVSRSSYITANFSNTLEDLSLRLGTADTTFYCVGTETNTGKDVPLYDESITVGEALNINPVVIFSDISHFEPMK
jgi:hypothetical protein